MGIKSAMRRWLGFAADPPPRPVAEVILEMNARGLLPRAGRAEALSVPAVLRARNLICSTATLPLIQRDANLNKARLPLLEQIDPDVPNVVTLAQTLEDLLFEGLSWWRVLERGFDGYPTYAQHLNFGSVTLQPRRGWLDPLPSGFDPRDADVYVNGERIVDPAAELIRFDCPNPGLLAAGGRVIRRAVLLDTTSALYADNPRPQDFFTPAEGADPADDDAIQKVLDDWLRSRKTRSTGYVPAALKYNAVDTPTPADLQLVELKRDATLDVANMTGLDPEDLGISTTSRTYQNGTDRRQDRINDTYSPYTTAITHRLSMGDITRRGYAVGFDLDDYLKADPLTRAKVYDLAGAGAWMTSDEARAEEGRAPLTAAQRASLAPIGAPLSAAAKPPTADNVVPIRRAALGADGSDMLVFAVDALPPLHVDGARRTVEGIVVPYGTDKIARKGGYRWRFQQGSLVPPAELKRNKALRDHDNAQPLGYLIHQEDRPEGMFARYKIAEGPDGDRALAEAASGIRDGFSVGVEINDSDLDPLNQGVYLVAVGGAVWRETSLLAVPAFDDARVTRVAASADRGEIMADPVTTDAPGTGAATTELGGNPPAPTPPPPTAVALNAEQLQGLLAVPGVLATLAGVPAAPQPAGPAPVEFGLSQQQIAALVGVPGVLPMLLGQAQIPARGEGPTRVNPVRQDRTIAVTQVAEASPYRFDRKGNLTRGPQYDFSSDVIVGIRDRNTDALDRAQKFVAEQFDTQTSNVSSLNPNIQRPDLYVDQKEFRYPIWNAIDKGTLNEITPFVLPKFSSSSGLVGAHSEAVEPTSGSFAATNQTITPSAVSGKVSITREAWDQGGNPQLSSLIWRQMIRAWYEALEAAAVTLLEGLTLAGNLTITLTTGATDDALVSELEGKLADLQFVRGGFRMTEGFGQVDLYKALAGATDADGRKLLPVINPSNAPGTTGPRYGFLDLNQTTIAPAWALAATGSVSANSYLFDPDDVSGWASAPNRLTMEQIEVRYVHIGIWGYKATACTDTTGVRRIAYDPVP